MFFWSERAAGRVVVGLHTRIREHNSTGSYKCEVWVCHGMSGCDCMIEGCVWVCVRCVCELWASFNLILLAFIFDEYMTYKVLIYIIILYSWMQSNIITHYSYYYTKQKIYYIYPFLQCSYFHRLTMSFTIFHPTVKNRLTTEEQLRLSLLGKILQKVIRAVRTSVCRNQE